MVLKSLIIQGFKSFPDKTEIRFSGGMTAIVGPNGSGKSNLSDALRWVLGEQSSKSLRGAKMEDVIFSGTARRKPVGFAEVALILDNTDGMFRSDYTEIMVTRRYYRSGESEYYLNRKHCRLRDIHELFMDTGLGRDGYSVIGQGRIDEVLSLKSEDRREIFEEAAGITKFRYRKEEAERRLAATEENLTRIRDVYDELERQVGPLAKQAEKARQYLLLRDELRVLEVSLWLLRLDGIRTESGKGENDLSVCTAQLDSAKERQDKLYAQSEALSARLREYDRDTDHLRQTLREAEQAAAGQTRQAAVLRANIQNSQENMERMQQEVAQRTEQVTNLGSQIAERRDHIRQLDEERRAIREQLDGLAEWDKNYLAQRKALETALQQAEQERNGQQEKLHQLALERTAAETGLSGMDSRSLTLVMELQAATERLQEERSRKAKQTEQLQACQETLSRINHDRTETEKKTEKCRRRTELFQSVLTKTEAALTDTRNRVKMLQEMQREYDGYSRSVRAVMAQAKRGGLRGVHGPVSSLLTADERYVIAIDTALGASASSIVVNTAADGKSCIAYLKRTDGGRATFLPLDTIRPHFLQENGLEKQPGCYGTADKLVSFDKQYTAIVQNLLARTVLSENMETALTLARAYGNRFRIVTLDGQIIQAGGAMTGGSASRGTGALARAAKLKQEEEQLHRLTLEQSRAAARYEEAEQELAALDQDRKTIESEQIQAGQTAAALQAALEQHGALLESMEQQYAALQQEHDSLSREHERYQAAITEYQARQKETETLQQQAEQRMAVSRAALEQLEAEAGKTSAAAATVRTALAEKETEASAESRALRDLEQLKQELDTGITDAKQTITGFEQKMHGLQEELSKAGQSVRKAQQAAAELNRRITEQVAQREQTEKKRTQANQEAQSRNEEILALEREKSRLENRIAQLKGEETQILDSMWEQYELTPTPAAAVAQEITNQGAAKEQTRELRSKMKALGNVNLNAVSAYQEVRERYTFLGEQKEDLEKSLKELNQVITELTMNMKEIFSSEFARLNGYFAETFHEIFGGGHAELSLADTSDVLNCGIDIRVSPPGKSVKTLTLLSGGEKAFVAIALYFAILKLRPAPFCVLDEIEAALDDVNVTRFAQYIRRLTEKTQFIVITHRRGTMEAADMLYGVTMQEQGVSRLLMLNLAEAEKRLGQTIL